MQIIMRTMLAAFLLVIGFSAGFPLGKSLGFATGSEWALVQADILARESGLFMPVSIEEGKFRVVIKQPRKLYTRAWQRADRHEDCVQSAYPVTTAPNVTVQVAENTLSAH